MITKHTLIAFIILLFAASVSFGQSSVPNDTLITLHRLTDAFGDAPEYNLTIKADGTATFKLFAKNFVAQSDPRARDSEVQGKVSVDIVAALVAAFERHKFFSLNDRYAEKEDGCPGGVWTDAPSAQISSPLTARPNRSFTTTAVSTKIDAFIRLTFTRWPKTSTYSSTLNSGSSKRDAQQIVGHDRRERVSHHNWSGDA